MRKPYPSDMTDEQWAIAEPLIPVSALGRPREVEMREVLRGDSVISLESRPVLPDDRSGEPTIRTEVIGDSIRQTSPTRTSAEKIIPGTYYTLTFTPFDQVRLARHLLRQSDHSARLSATTTVHLEVVREAFISV